jgi:hypothetical protein
MVESRGRTSDRHKRDLWDKIWRNKKGEIVLTERPNIPLIIWVILTPIAIFTTGTLSNVLYILAVVSLAIWALLVIILGTNYFRRFLGTVVAVLIIFAFLKVGY